MPTMHEFVMEHGNLDLGDGESVAQLSIPPSPAATLEAGLTAGLEALDHDREDLDMLRAYRDGDQLAPYAPTNTTEQIKDLQERAITNLMPLLIGLPTQVLDIAGYRRARPDDAVPGVPLTDEQEHAIAFSPEWKSWVRCRMRSRQSLIWQTAFTYGYAYVVVDNRDEKPKVRVLPSRKTIGLFRDSANEIVPDVLLTVISYPTKDALGELEVVDETGWYTAWFDDDNQVMVDQDSLTPHNMGRTPAVRFHCYLDDEGRTSGMVDRAIRPQDRVNQASFTTDTISNNSSFKVRYAAGLVPTFKRGPNGEPLLDEHGNPIPEPVQISQAKLLMSDKADTKFGTLDETPVAGFVTVEEQALRNFAVISQFPTHIFLGNISNLSAEALDAAEAQFARLVDWLQRQFAAGAEEIMRLLAAAEGDMDGAESYGGEIRWERFSLRAFGTWMDGLAKAAESLGAPKRGLWALMPELPAGTLEQWEMLKAAQDADEAVAAGADLDAVARRELAPTAAVVTEEAEAAESSIF